MANKKQKRFLAVFLLLPILVSILGSCLAFFAQSKVSAQAVADPTGKVQVIDGATMIYNGVTYKDKNPYDGTHELLASSGCDDNNKIKIHDFDSEAYAEVTLYQKTATGDCVEQDASKGSKLNQVDLFNAGKRYLQGHRLDENNIFFPVGFHDPGCGLDVQQLGVDKDNSSMFQRAPAGDPDFKPNVYYWLHNGKLEKSIILTTSSTSAGSVVEDFDCGGGVYDIRYESSISSEARTAYGIGADNKPPDSADATAEEAKPADSCENNGGVLAWLLCGLLGLGDKLLEATDNAVQNILKVPNSYLEKQPDGKFPLHDAWRRMRAIAYIILVPMMLVMVISTALGFDFVSAYTVKKSLPRLVAATLFIALSFDICKFLIILTNDVGGGLQNLILHSLSGGKEVTLQTIFETNNGGTAAGVGFAVVLGGVGWALGSIGIALSFLVVAIAAIAIGFFLLSLRQLILVALIMLAPLAILSWVFPGNNKLWKLWWETFSKLLMLYPIIMVLIGAGKGFAFIVGDVGGGTLVNTIIKLIAYVGPYFFIPEAFKLAGGAFASLTGMANNRSKGLFDRQKKYRSRKAAENYRDFKAGNKAWRPRAFNNVGRRVGAGFSGRYGFGNTGREAIALNAQANADEAAKNNPRLQKLAFHDDGNAVMALSGGTRAGAEAAARQLFTDENGVYDEARANRAIAAAQAVGFNRSNAQAALTTLAQNKARSIPAGAAGRRIVRDGIDRLGGDTQIRDDIQGNFAYNASGAGRGDLGATNWNETAVGAAGAPPIDTAGLAGFERTGLYQAANEHDRGISGALEAAQNLANSGVEENLDRAAVHLEELRAMLPNTTGPARDAVNNSIAALEGNIALHNHLGQATGATEVEALDTDRADPTHFRYDAAYAGSWSAADLRRGSRARAQTRADLARHAARSYERPDPNHHP